MLLHAANHRVSGQWRGRLCQLQITPGRIPHSHPVGRSELLPNELLSCSSRGNFVWQQGGSSANHAAKRTLAASHTLAAAVTRLIAHYEYVLCSAA